jgi:hypothetical protein
LNTGFRRRQDYIVFFAPPGVDETHLVIGKCDAGLSGRPRVLFVTTPEWVSAAHRSGRLHNENTKGD